MRENTRELAHTLGVEDRVHFLGIRHDIPVCLKASVGMLLLSEREGLPRSIMEAFCLGTPVIATDVRGCRDLVKGNGILVPVGAPDALASAMCRLRDDPAEASRMSERASIAIRDYDVTAVVHAHDELYDTVLGTRDTSRSVAARQSAA